LVNALILLQEKGNLLFQGKRNTLEDKAIVGNFFELLSIYSQILERLCPLLEKMDMGFNHSTNSSIMETLNGLSELNSLIESLLDGCLKAINYNYNYFEQYYEYDFVAKLNEQELQSRLLGLRDRLASTMLCS
jgi:hypothetical protein